jgi:aspartyl aminopeptidase
MAHSFDTDTEAQGLIDFVDASPTPFHACEQAAARLGEAGFTEVVETERLAVRSGPPLAGARRLPRRLGQHGRTRGRRRTGRRLPGRGRPHRQPEPPAQAARRPRQGRVADAAPSSRTVASSSTPWLDRDLGLAGRVAVRAAGRVDTRLFHDARRSLGLPARHPPRPQPERRAHAEPRSSTWCPCGASATSPRDVTRYLAEQVGRRHEDVCRGTS